jgi:polar amino acid transport system substrate-binding protein
LASWLAWFPPEFGTIAVPQEETRMRWRFALVALLAAASVPQAARADQLQDIKSRGKLICATLGTFEPFSYQDPTTREIIGYDVDFCRAVAKAIGVSLEVKPVSVEARIPELTQGRVDIVAAAMGYSDMRAQQIGYSKT